MTVRMIKKGILMTTAVESYHAVFQGTGSSRGKFELDLWVRIRRLPVALADEYMGARVNNIR